MNVRRERNDRRACLKKSGIRASEEKQVYISKETHCRISMTIHLLGNGEVTIVDFTENVVREYPRTHRDGLNRMLNTVPKVEL